MWFKNPRVGRFVIEAELIEDQPEVVKAILGSVIVLKADFRADQKVIEYWAIGDQFEPLDGGTEAYTYDIEVGEDGSITFSKAE